MEKDLIKEFLFERILLPGVINGSRFDLEDTEIPLVGIKGMGSKHERNDKKSIWINGVILSPNVISNNSCASKSYIEGIVTYDGTARFLEIVSDFLAYEGACFDYDLKMKNSSDKFTPQFEGSLFYRKPFDKGSPEKRGRVYLNMNSHWSNSEDGGAEIVYSLPRAKRNMVSGEYVPHFWRSFLGEIEEKGFDHPYGAVTEALEKERKSNQKKIEWPSRYPKSSEDDLPF